MEKKFSVFSLSILGAICFFGSISFAIYMTWQEEKLKSSLTNEALKGNTHAIRFLAKYKKPWKDTKVVSEAIKGNKYALEILKIGEKQKKEQGKI